MLFDLMLDEGVQDDLIKAINDKDYLIMTYNGPKKHDLVKREIVPVALGKSKSGNDVVRAFQLYGDSASKKPRAWKFFRLDRIRDLQPDISKNSAKRFHRFHLPDAFTFGKYNPMDKTMSYVSNYANFSRWESTPKQEQSTTPKNDGNSNNLEDNIHSIDTNDENEEEMENESFEKLLRYNLKLIK